MRTYLAIAAAALLISGCGSADPDKRKAGKWTTEAELTKLEMTGVPAGAEKQVEAMKAQMGAQMKSQLGREECITADQAAKEDISRDFLRGMNTGGDCKLTTNKVGGGSMDIASTCTMGPSKMDITMNGTTSPEKIDAVVTMKGGAPGGGPQIDMEMKVAGRHVGDC